MSKVERAVKLFVKEVMLSAFYPKPGETIFLTIDPDKIDLEEGTWYIKYLAELFPNNNVILKIDGMTIESMMEDDLK